MKKIFKYLPLLAVITLASCAKEAPSKDSVESGFTKFTGTLPTVSIASNAECHPLDGYATVKVTYTGITTSLDSLSVGVLSDTDPTFRTANYTKIESPADGTVSVNAKVTPNKTFYIRGVVACTGGTSYSDVIEVKVPDVPFYAKIAGTYAAKVTSADDGSEYTNTLTVVLDESDPQSKCRIFGLEPYYVKNGYGTDVTRPLNYCDATIDNDAKTLTIENGTNLHLTTSDASRYLYGFDNPDPEKASDDFVDVVFKWGTDDASLYLPNGYGTVAVAKDSGKASFEDLYHGDISYKKN